MIFKSCGPKDVLMGRGRHGNLHEGNRAWRRMVRTWKPRYKRASDREKKEVARELVRQWYNDGGRFLKKYKEIYYVEISFDVAVNKTCQRFREPFNEEEHVDNAIARSRPLDSNGHREIVANNNRAPDIPAAPVYADARVIEVSAEPLPIASPFAQAYGVYSPAPAEPSSGFDQTESMPIARQVDNNQGVSSTTTCSTDGYIGKTSGDATDGTHESFVIENEKWWCGNTEELVVVTATEVSPCEDTKLPALLLAEPSIEDSSSPAAVAANPNALAAPFRGVSPTAAAAAAAGLHRGRAADSENGFASTERTKYYYYDEFKNKEEEASFSLFTTSAETRPPILPTTEQQQVAQDSADGVFDPETFDFDSSAFLL